MNYYNELTLSNGLILSCDKLRLNFKLNDLTFKNINKFFVELSIKNSIYDYQMYESRNFFNYKYLLTFSHKESVISVGLGFNGVKQSENYNCFIEFNPNKSLVNGYVTPILDYIKAICDLELSRFDFAIDIPTKRGFVYLAKDKRNYEKVYKITQTANRIDNFTEYLGQRNNNGFVKLYNKTIESKLNYDLTRLELTLDSLNYDNFKKELPNVFFLRNVDLLTFNDVSASDRVFLSLLMHSDNPLMYLNMLGRDKKEKYSKILFNKFNLDISENIFYSYIFRMRSIYC